MRSSGSRLNPGTLALEELIRADLRPLAGKPVLVVGDLILDHYLWGNVERTTPEAPVPIVRHEGDSWGLGGAGNVVRNIKALGGDVRVIGTVGEDEEGRRILQSLRDLGVSTSAVAVVPGRPTTVKTRVLSMGQQLLRIDREETGPMPPETAARLARQLERLAPHARVVVLSDYAKGVLSPAVIAAGLRAARRAKIPVIVDPKGQDYDKYKGADVLTPNQREAALASGRAIANEDDLQRAGRDLIRRCKLKALLVTRGPEGVAVLRPGRKMLGLPARAREVYDVTGAGDTFIGTLALGMAAGLDVADAAGMANRAGGIVVEKLGVATVSPQELKLALSEGESAGKIRSVEELQIILANQRTRGRKVVFTNGCFDLLHPGHIRFLHAARRLGDLLVVGLNTDRSVRALKGPSRPILPQEERGAILSALEAVDYVVFFDDLTPEPLLAALRPDVLAKGRNIPEKDVVGREIVRSYGGRVCRLPILHPSTVTDLVDSIVGKHTGKNRR